jgi:hypothetical protein
MSMRDHPHSTIVFKYDWAPEPVRRGIAGDEDFIILFQTNCNARADGLLNSCDIKEIVELLNESEITILNSLTICDHFYRGVFVDTDGVSYFVFVTTHAKEI